VDEVDISFQVTPVFLANYQAQEGVVVNRGGTRSSKTYSLAQLLVLKLFTEPEKQILIARRTLPALKISAMKDVIDILHAHDIYDGVQHNKAEMTLTCEATRSQIVFRSLDDPQKFRGPEWNYVLLNEANEIPYELFRQIQLRMSRNSKDGKKNQLFLDFNPDDPEIWIKAELEDKGRCKTVVSTYRDNSFLSPETVANIEYLRENDPNFWNVFGLGLYGQRNKGLIYPAWDTYTEEPPEGLVRLYGLDFGFNKPAALVEVRANKAEAYVRELLYREGLTDVELISMLKELIPNRADYLYADAAEPKAIEAIRRAGFNVYPADKSVKPGILFTKAKRLHFHGESENLKKEARSYKWKETKNGELLDEPLKFRDHLMDALRYALFTYGQKYLASSTSDIVLKKYTPQRQRPYLQGF